MRLTRNKIFPGIIIFWYTINILALFDVNNLYLRAIFSFVFLTTIPGLLIMLMLKIRKIGFWEYLVYTIGLSIAFLMFGGLLINWTLPLAGIDKPLSFYPISISFHHLLLVFGLVAYLRNKDISYELKFTRLSGLNWFFFLIPLVFPILSVLGAISLNNNGPNYLTMIMLGGIALYVFLVVLMRNKLNENAYLFAILTMATSLLLTFSLRSWYISGPDISSEYRMFQLTKENFHWSMTNFPGHAYNACLSVTILPAVFSSFLKVNDQYIFKLIISLLFPMILVVVYLLFIRYIKRISAFLATFFFISYLSSSIDMPTQIRQGVALLFFALSLLILFNKTVNPLLKKTLFLVFGFLMVVSHYSTTYIALGLFVFAYLLCLVFRKTINKKPFSRVYEKLNLKEKEKKLDKRKHHLSGMLVLLLIVFTFLWNLQITKSSNDLVNFIHETIRSMGKIFTEEVRAQQISFFDQFNIFYQPKDPTPLLQNYTKEITLMYKNREYVNPYPIEKCEDYKPRVIDTEFLSLKTTPRVTAKIYLFMEIIRKLVKAFIIIGVFHLLFIQFKKETIDKEYTIMALGGLFWLVVIMIMPFASIEYDLMRTYQQALIILSLPAVLGGLAIFKFFKKNTSITLVLIMFLFYFLIISGFIPQIVGGIDAYIQLNNTGTHYDRFYTHKTEIGSIQWLSNHYDRKNLIYADEDARRKQIAFGKYTVSVLENSVLPSTIDKNAYLYSGYTNTVKKRTFIFTRGTSIGYNFPLEFLNQNKNLIYNNKGSKISK